MKSLLNSVVTISTSLLASMLSACGEPEQQFKVKVMDESNTPMKGVEVSAWFNRAGKNSPLDSYKVTGSTDAAGLVELQGETVWYQTSVSAQPEGYYKSMKYGHWTITKNGDRWEPWPVEVDLVMKKIQNPKPMYVAKFDNQKWHRFPNKELGPFGFDLMMADWVSPHGRGEIADFVLTAVRDDVNDSSVMPKGKVILSFSNKLDGIFQIEEEGGSLLVGPSKAPDNQQYKPEWIFDNFKRNLNKPDEQNNDFSSEIYIFRIRTKTDNNDHVTSALYGKIDGRIVGWLPKAAPSILMTYYLNGTPNDMGLEWDMKNNLIKDTSRMRIPRRP